MRSSLVLAAALAAGAIASPIEKRRIVTHVEWEVKTITVYVTAAAAQPTAEDKPEVPDNGNWANGGHGDLPEESSAAPAPAPPESQPTSEAPAPTPSPEPAPSQPESSPDVSSEAPEPEPTSTTPTEAPASSTTEPADGSRPTGEAQATLSSGPEYQAAMLYHHNAIRAIHGAQPLVWDADCEAGARRTAETCTFKHPDFLQELNQGENLFTVSGDAFNATAGIVESWYKAELGPMTPYFGSADLPEDVFHSVGHLTALLWKSTSKVGCVSLDCGDRMKLGDGTPTDMNKFTVCHYFEPGNFAGQYAEQVAPPIDSGFQGSWAD